MSKRIVTFAEIILLLAPNGYCRFFQDDRHQAPSAVTLRRQA